MTMKKIFLIFLPLLAILGAGCTHNDGDIGPWFGTWQLEEITADGTVDTGYHHDIFWQFQNTVFCMRKVTAMHDVYPRWGTWQETGNDILRLDFTNHDNDHPEGSTIYIPFPETHIRPNGITELKIMEMSGSELHLQYAAPEGTLYDYYLKKWR